MGDGLVGTASVDDVTQAFVLDGDLEEVSQATNPSGSLAVTPDGAIVGWLTTEGSPTSWSAAAARSGTFRRRRGGVIAALVATATPARRATAGAGAWRS